MPIKTRENSGLVLIYQTFILYLSAEESTTSSYQTTNQFTPPEISAVIGFTVEAGY